MINHQGLTLYPLTPDVIATRPDLDPWQRDEQILHHRGGGGWTDLGGRQHPARLIRSVCQPSDALYYWDGPWGVLSGSRGIAVVHDRHVLSAGTRHPTLVAKMVGTRLH
jgi:hypothetical protein